MRACGLACVRVGRCFVLGLRCCVVVCLPLRSRYIVIICCCFPSINCCLSYYCRIFCFCWLFSFRLLHYSIVFMYILGCFHAKRRHFCAVRFSALVRIIAGLFQNPVKTLKNGLYSRNTFEINHVYAGLFSSIQYIKSEMVRNIVTKI